MAEVLDSSALDRWQRQPISFVAEVLRDPETGRPFNLLNAEREFLARAYKTDESGRLLYPEQVYGAPKKSGKTGFAAMNLLTMTLVYGGPFSEGYAVANDLEQAQGRVFQASRRIVEASPLLRRECNVTQSRLEFPETGAVISAIGSDYAGAAGANPVISSFDELWAFTSERSYRLWDEMTPPPTRKISARLCTTYAGFEGESVLLEDLLASAASSDHASATTSTPATACSWHGTTSRLRPGRRRPGSTKCGAAFARNQFLRMIENRFVTTESSFVDLDWVDACVDPNATPVVIDKSLPVWLGVDASVKHDSTAIVAVTFDIAAKKARLVAHRIFQPTAADPLNFEAAIEDTVLDMRSRFAVRGVYFDPFQMASTSQRLTAAGVPMRECPQSVPNLTAMGSNLYELIKGQGIVVYPDDAIRLAVSRTIALETPRGMRLAKEKSSHKIDVVIALAMAALGAVQEGQKPRFVATWEMVAEVQRYGAARRFQQQVAARAVSVNASEPNRTRFRLAWRLCNLCHKLRLRFAAETRTFRCLTKPNCRPTATARCRRAFALAPSPALTA